MIEIESHLSGGLIQYLYTGDAPTLMRLPPTSSHRRRRNTIVPSTMSANPTPLRKDSVASSTGSGAEEDLYRSSDYLDALEDVHTRFILNLPDSELASADRIMFQLEQAWWFYEDWICDPHPDRRLPRFSTFKPFAQRLFAYSPLLPDPNQFASMWQEFSNYKRKISNYGCILLSEDCSSVILCRLWDSSTYTFPAGKINQGETGLDAAARETYEETGFDPLCRMGTTAEWAECAPEKITWKPLREADALVFSEDSGKRRTCYVCAGVPQDFAFAPVARKEVSEVSWHRLDCLPKKSYAVNPFVNQLKKWIKKKLGGANTNKSAKKKKEHTPTRGKRSGSRQHSRGKVRSDDNVVEAGLASVGDISGWSEEDMFETNERLLGRKIEYDGNPHAFSEQGFQGKDPHSFHIVGGHFLNAGGVTSLAPAPERSKLQPLFRVEDDSDKELQPFFADDGVTPWGEAVADGQATIPPPPAVVKDEGAALLSMLQAGGCRKQPPPMLVEGGDNDALFLTDVEITAQSQARKLAGIREARRRQYQDDLRYIREWVARLPKSRPTKHFGEFKLDAEAIMAKAMESWP